MKKFTKESIKDLIIFLQEVEKTLCENLAYTIDLIDDITQIRTILYTEYAGNGVIQSAHGVAMSGE